jgi:hypothetical protein
MYKVYEIKVDGVIRYFGRTKDIRRRLSEHRRGLKNYYIGIGRRKSLYENIVKNYPNGYEIDLVVVKEFKKSIDAKRWEMFLILEYYFMNWGQLWQKVPNISDR